MARTAQTEEHFYSPVPMGVLHEESSDGVGISGFAEKKASPMPPKRTSSLARARRSYHSKIRSLLGKYNCAKNNNYSSLSLSSSCGGGDCSSNNVGGRACFFGCGREKSPWPLTNANVEESSKAFSGWWASRASTLPPPKPKEAQPPRQSLCSRRPSFEDMVNRAASVQPTTNSMVFIKKREEEEMKLQQRELAKNGFGIIQYDRIAVLPLPPDRPPPPLPRSSSFRNNGCNSGSSVNDSYRMRAKKVDFIPTNGDVFAHNYRARSAPPMPRYSTSSYMYCSMQLVFTSYVGLSMPLSTFLNVHQPRLHVYGSCSNATGGLLITIDINLLWR